MIAKGLEPCRSESPARDLHETLEQGVRSQDPALFRNSKRSRRPARHSRRTRDSQEHQIMSEQEKTNAKVQKPSAHFDEPKEVLADSSLSNAQKVDALDTLEQDARQLAEASSEGMA